MKKLFPLYYRPTDEEKMKLFNSKDCYFIFDTNALLDLYRIGQEATDQVLELIGKYKDRVVIPYHVAEEYHEDFLKVLTEYKSTYHNLLRDKDKNNEAKKELLDCLYEKLNINKCPNVKDRLKSYMSEAFSKFYDDIKKEEEYLQKQFGSWDLQHRISDTLGSRVLDGLTESEIKDIEDKGKTRYENQVPPGYEDSTKRDNIYGDLIIWKEILKFAGENNCSVIFVSRDLKDDWIYKPNGMICGPRQELLSEFKTVSDGVFLICELNKFLEYANKQQKVLKDSDIERLDRILRQWEPVVMSGMKEKSSVYSEINRQLKSRIGANKVSIASEESEPKIYSDDKSQHEKDIA